MSRRPVERVEASVENGGWKREGPQGMCGKRYGEIRRERCALGRREGELGDRTDEEREGKGGKASKRRVACRRGGGGGEAAGQAKFVSSGTSPCSGKHAMFRCVTGGHPQRRVPWLRRVETPKHILHNRQPATRRWAWSPQARTYTACITTTERTSPPPPARATPPADAPYFDSATRSAAARRCFSSIWPWMAPWSMPMHRFFESRNRARRSSFRCFKWAMRSSSIATRVLFTRSAMVTRPKSAAGCR